MYDNHKMKNDDGIHRLPPPPLFTIRPPPKPPGPMFEHFDAVQIFNGQCVRSSLNQLSSSTNLHKTNPPITWFNLFLLISLVICVICCIIIVIFIFICLKKLKKEEKQYKDYLTSGSLSLKSHRHHHMTTCTRTNEHYKCTSNVLNCCDDYYTHQLMPMTHNTSSSSSHRHQHINKSTDDQDTPQHHQYECIPEHLLTMTRHHTQQCYQRINGPYSNFSRLYLTPQEAMKNASDCSQCTCSSLPSTIIQQEESSIPLLTENVAKESHKRDESSSMMIEWTKTNLFS